MRIGCDLDGVLCDFAHGYERIHAEVAGFNNFPPDQLPPIWNWPELYGYTAEHTSEVWRRIKASPTFWASLEPLPGARNFLTTLSLSAHEVYFITDRPGVDTQLQSASWLESHGYHAPSVIVTGKPRSKGEICRALAIDLMIDDKPENIEDIADYSPATKAVILSYPYNEDYRRLNPETLSVSSLDEFAEAYL